MKAVFDGLKPFTKELNHTIGTEDVERLLKIPIRRISLYDIEKAKKEMEQIQQQLARNEDRLNHLVSYAIETLKTYRKMIESLFPRRTRIKSFKKSKQKALHATMLLYDTTQMGAMSGQRLPAKKSLRPPSLIKF